MSRLFLARRAGRLAQRFVAGRAGQGRPGSADHRHQVGRRRRPEGSSCRRRSRGLACLLLTPAIMIARRGDSLATDAVRRRAFTCSPLISAASARAAGRASARAPHQQSDHRPATGRLTSTRRWPGSRLSRVSTRRSIGADRCQLRRQPGGATREAASRGEDRRAAERRCERRAARLFLRDSPAFPVLGGGEPRRQRGGRSDAVDSRLVAQPVEQVPRIQNGRAWDRDVRGREGTRAAVLDWFAV